MTNTQNAEPKRATRSAGDIHVPRMRWGGRWQQSLAEAPHDGEWHLIATYGRTSGYQIARALGIARQICSLSWEFGSRTLPTSSELYARWRPTEGGAA